MSGGDSRQIRIPFAQVKDRKCRAEHFLTEDIVNFLTCCRTVAEVEAGCTRCEEQELRNFLLSDVPPGKFMRPVSEVHGLLTCSTCMDKCRQTKEQFGTLTPDQLTCIEEKVCCLQDHLAIL